MFKDRLSVSIACFFFFKIKGMKPQNMLGSSDNIIFAHILA